MFQIAVYPSHAPLQVQIIEIKPLCLKATKFYLQIVKFTTNLENQISAAPLSCLCF
jgi:hypothetical protein